MNPPSLGGGGNQAPFIQDNILETPVLASINAISVWPCVDTSSSDSSQENASRIDFNSSPLARYTLLAFLRSPIDCIASADFSNTD